LQNGIPNAAQKEINTVAVGHEGAKAQERQDEKN
jgi:hypothetical protein